MIELKDERELTDLLEASRGDGIFVFKHSTACPISAAACRRVSEYLDSVGDKPLPFYLVKVIESRPLSNAIARELSIGHASPQLILVRNGNAVWDTSHGGITAEAIESATTAKR